MKKILALLILFTLGVVLAFFWLFGEADQGTPNQKPPYNTQHNNESTAQSSKAETSSRQATLRPNRSKSTHSIAENMQRNLFFTLHKETASKPNNQSQQPRRPAQYTLSRTSSASVSVNLAGGEAETYSPQPDSPPNLNRLMHGYVLRKGGDPVSAVPVVVGGHINNIWNHLSGNYGAVSDEDGRFSFFVESDRDYIAMAIHPSYGWSQPYEIKAGKAPIEIELILPEPGSIEGVVKRNDQPEYADLWLTYANITKLKLYKKSDQQTGEYRFENLPPGEYTVMAMLGMGQFDDFFGGSAVPVSKTVTLEEGQKVRVDLELPLGGLIVASVIFYDGWVADTIEYFLLKGNHNIGPADNLDAVASGLPKGEALAMLVGGIDAKQPEPMQFHDLLPGDYTLCIKSKKKDQPTTRQKCKIVTVQPHSNVIEVTIDLDS